MFDLIIGRYVHCYYEARNQKEAGKSTPKSSIYQRRIVWYRLGRCVVFAG